MLVSVCSVRPVTGLLRASHPLPSLTVTVFATAFGVLAAGLGPGTAALFACAVLTGQLSVGWSNDRVDAGRDVAADRLDKPVPAGLVPARLVGVAAVVALACCVVASLALGLLPGVLHLVAVASAWAYNLGLKATVASPLPYAVSFGLLVAAATTSATPAAWPGVGVVLAAALLGVGAHFANTVGDTEYDRLTGVRGLPQRLGPGVSLLVTAVLVGCAAGVLLLDGPAGGESAGTPAGTVLLVAGASVAALSAVLSGVLSGVPSARGRSPALSGPLAFRLTLLAVALVVGGFLLAPGPS